MYGALNAAREARQLSWRQLAKDIEVSPSLLSRIGNGYRPDADGFATLVRWLGMPAEKFMASDDEQAGPQPDLVAELAPLLRARKDLSKADVTYLEEVIQATVRRARAERPHRGHPGGVAGGGVPEGPADRRVREERDCLAASLDHRGLVRSGDGGPSTAVPDSRCVEH